MGHLSSEDDHPHWAPPYWNIMKETFYLGKTELLLQKLTIKSFGGVYKEIKSSILPNNSSYSAGVLTKLIKLIYLNS